MYSKCMQSKFIFMLNDYFVGKIACFNSNEHPRTRRTIGNVNILLTVVTESMNEFFIQTIKCAERDNIFVIHKYRMKDCFINLKKWKQTMTKIVIAK